MKIQAQKLSIVDNMRCIIAFTTMLHTSISVFCTMSEQNLGGPIYFEDLGGPETHLIPLLNESVDWHHAIQTFYETSIQRYSILNAEPPEIPPWAKDPIQLREIEVISDQSYKLLFTEQDGQEKSIQFEYKTCHFGDESFPIFSQTGDKTILYRVYSRNIEKVVAAFHTAIQMKINVAM